MDRPYNTPFAVITGASTGIGFELAKQFADHGYDLLVTSQSERINGAAVELRAMGAKVTAVRADSSTIAVFLANAAVSACT